MAGVSLSLIDPSHHERIRQLAKDPDVAVPANLAHLNQPGGYQHYFDSRHRALQEGTAFGFSVIHHRTVVGGTNINRIRGRGRWGELSFWIGKPYWGRGFGSEAIVQTLEVAFGALGLHTLSCRCFAWNRGAQRLLLKQGFKHDTPDDTAVESSANSILHFSLQRDSQLASRGQQ